jgi:hypothetical protein
VNLYRVWLGIWGTQQQHLQGEAGLAGCEPQAFGGSGVGGGDSGEHQQGVTKFWLRM